MLLCYVKNTLSAYVTVLSVSFLCRGHLRRFYSQSLRCTNQHDAPTTQHRHIRLGYAIERPGSTTTGVAGAPEPYATPKRTQHRCRPKNDTRRTIPGHTQLPSRAPSGVITSLSLQSFQVFFRRRERLFAFFCRRSTPVQRECDITA